MNVECCTLKCRDLFCSLFNSNKQYVKYTVLHPSKSLMIQDSRRVTVLRYRCKFPHIYDPQKLW
nr:MAG TPA: hypothetical protein [Caudoviricetes sp.]